MLDDASTENFTGGAMVAIKREPQSGVHYLDPAEARIRFDRQARRIANVSGDEFIEKWERGDYKGLVDENRKLFRLAMLIPFGRRHS